MFEDHKNLGAGFLFIALALYFGITAIAGLKLGTAAQMGPGYFPMLVSFVLLVLGIAIAAQALRRVPSRLGTIPWRALPSILGAPVIFGLTLRPLGLGPSLLLMLLVTMTASREASITTVVLTSLGLTIGCILVFVVGLGLPLTTFGTLFGGR